MHILPHVSLVPFFFNDTATTEIYTLSLHDALPIYGELCNEQIRLTKPEFSDDTALDRKSTRLNSSHANISYAVFCLKKKKIIYAHDHFNVGEVANRKRMNF